MRDFILFGIDPQNAFGQEGNPLCVPGAPEDMLRVAQLIGVHQKNIKDIVITMDTHDVNHVGHPSWWRLADDTEPAMFTLVTPEMLAAGEIRAADPALQEHAVNYVNALGPVMIWPVHCVPGTESYEMVQCVEAAIVRWEVHQRNRATLVKKGFQRNVEAFGVFAAEYQDGSLGSDFNVQLLANLMYRRLPIVVVGEALSHCVKRSVEQMLQFLDNNGDKAEVILVVDCMSPVPGFEEAGDAFVADCAQRGVVICKTTDLPAVLA